MDVAPPKLLALLRLLGIFGLWSFLLRFWFSLLLFRLHDPQCVKSICATHARNLERCLKFWRQWDDRDPTSLGWWELSATLQKSQLYSLPINVTLAFHHIRPFRSSKAQSKSHCWPSFFLCALFWVFVEASRPSKLRKNNSNTNQVKTETFLVPRTKSAWIHSCDL